MFEFRMMDWFKKIGIQASPKHSMMMMLRFNLETSEGIKFIQWLVYTSNTGNIRETETSFVNIS